MKMRCKVKVESVEYTQMGCTIKATPVTGGSDENASFFKYTPFGEIRLGTINPDLVFHPGDAFYVDFVPVTA